MLDYKRFFPYSEYRDAEQERVFNTLCSNFHSYDVFCIIAPVAFGKGALAKGILNFSNSQGMPGNVMVPDNQLVQQGLDEFPDYDQLKLSNQYGGSVGFAAAQERARRSKQVILNPMTLLSSRLYKPTLVIDEAHKTISVLQEMGGMKVWENSAAWHPALRDVTQAIMHFSEERDPQSKKVLKAILKDPENFCLAYETGTYNHQPREVLSLYQLSPKDNPPVLWPPHRTKKIFLMSATISMKDVEELGLANRRILMIEAKSGIPPERAPIILDFQGSMTAANQRETLPKVVRRLHELSEAHPDERGFIHGTYNVAASMRAEAGDYGGRWIYHTKDDKGEKLKKWLKESYAAGKDPQSPGPDNTVFVGSGLTQGIDLKYGKARWQAITKCMIPSLGDPAIRRKMEQDHTWFAWTTIREILQAVGRVARAPDDYGETYILDSYFMVLFNKYEHLFPGWFKERMQ